MAADFFSMEVWTHRGLQRFVVRFVIELSTRKAEIAGIATVANGLWMSQPGRNLTDAVAGIVNGKRYLIHDRDPLFTAEFLTMLADVGVKSVKLPVVRKYLVPNGISSLELCVVARYGTLRARIGGSKNAFGNGPC